MCGRFSQAIAAETIATNFGVKIDDIYNRYNVAPSQSVLAISRSPEDPARQLRRLQWGLIPAWAKDPKIGFKSINARAETIAEKPSFRSAFRQRRCLIPTDGFYEWQQGADRRHKQPYFIGMSDDSPGGTLRERPFAFAGLYECWDSPAGDRVETCTIITTEANELVAPIHDRMPVILAPEDYDLWLDPDFARIDRLQSLLVPYPADSMSAYPVSTIVNSPKNDTPECKQPVEVN